MGIIHHMILQVLLAKIWPFLFYMLPCYYPRPPSESSDTLNCLLALDTVARTHCPVPLPSTLLVTAITSTRCCLHMFGFSGFLDVYKLGCSPGKGVGNVTFPDDDYAVPHGYCVGLNYWSHFFTPLYEDLMMGTEHVPAL